MGELESRLEKLQELVRTANISAPMIGVSEECVEVIAAALREKDEEIARLKAEIEELTRDLEDMAAREKEQA